MGTLICVYDTETSGLPLYKQPSDDPAQPHLVEISAGLYDLETENLVATFHSIVRPDGWVIAPEVAAIHGIDQERALADGRPEADVVEDFLLFARRAALRVAHNEAFDSRILRIAIKRYQGEAAADAWSEAPSRCTAQMSTKLVNLPPTEKMLAKGMNFPKTPSLTECLKHFFDEDSGEEAHAASYDRHGCARVFFHVRRLQPDHPLMPDPKAPRGAKKPATPRYTITASGPVTTQEADLVPPAPAASAANELDFL